MAVRCNLLTDSANSAGEAAAPEETASPPEGTRAPHPGPAPRRHRRPRPGAGHPHFCFQRSHATPASTPAHNDRCPAPRPKGSGEPSPVLPGWAGRGQRRGDASGHRGPLTDTSNHERPESKAPGEGWAGRGPRLGDAFGAARGHAGAGTHVSPVGVGAVLALEAAHQALVRLVAHGPHRVQAPLDLGGHGRPSGGLRADSPLPAQPASAGEASAVGRSGHPSRAPPRPSEPGRDCGRHPGPYGVSTDTSCLCTLGAGSTPPPES